MIALLKILLAAAPTSMAKTDPINIMTDVLPEEMPMTVMQSMKLGRRRTLLLGILCVGICYLYRSLVWLVKIHREGKGNVG